MIYVTDTVEIPGRQSRLAAATGQGGDVGEIQIRQVR